MYVICIAQYNEAKLLIFPTGGALNIKSIIIMFVPLNETIAWEIL